MVYMSDKKVLGLFNGCLDELYRASNPSIGWDEVQKKYSGSEHSDFYLRYCIDEVVYDRIVSRYKKRMTPFYRSRFAWFLLDFAPTFCNEEVEV